MTASELIEHLQALPPDTKINVWHDDRYPINEEAPIDWYFVDEYGFADINLGTP